MEILVRVKYGTCENIILGFFVYFKSDKKTLTREDIIAITSDFDENSEIDNPP